VVDYLMRRGDVDSTKVGAIGINEMCIPLIHAAAFDPSINNITLIGSILSYKSIAMNRFTKLGITKNPRSSDYWHPVEVDFSWGIASVLTAYDLPDLIGCIAPRKVVMAGPTDPMFEPASTEMINSELEFPRSVYSFKHSPGNLKILEKMDGLESIVNWGFE